MHTSKQSQLLITFSYKLICVRYKRCYTVINALLMLYKLFISIPGEKAAVIKDSVFQRSLIYKMLSQSLNLTKLQRGLMDGLLFVRHIKHWFVVDVCGMVCVGPGILPRQRFIPWVVKEKCTCLWCVFVGLLTAHNFCHLFMTARSGIGELREISNTHTQTYVDLAKWRLTVDYYWLNINLIIITRG